jgi:hypothetical protein
MYGSVRTTTHFFKKENQPNEARFDSLAKFGRDDQPEKKSEKAALKDTKSKLLWRFIRRMHLPC